MTFSYGLLIHGYTSDGWPEKNRLITSVLPIGMDGERGWNESKLSACLDDDDDDVHSPQSCFYLQAGCSKKKKLKKKEK